MARVTVEDCIDKVPNKYKLVLLAAYRAKELSQGAIPTLERQDDKNSVIGLREIAASTPENKNALNYEDLSEYIVHSMQKHVEVDEAEEDMIPRIPYVNEKSHESQELTRENVFADHTKDDANRQENLQKEKEEENQSMSEEDFLRGLSGLPPAANPGNSRSGL